MKRNILLIEDDKDMNSELSKSLIDLNFTVQNAADGLAGKKLIKKNQYDFIILDLKMPHFDGFQILELIHKRKIQSVVIVITARMSIQLEENLDQKKKENEETLLKLADFILIKPFEIRDLINIIKK